MPAMDLTQGFQGIPALNFEYCWVEFLDHPVPTALDGLKKLVGNVSIAALTITGPYPTGPGVVHIAHFNLVSRLKQQGNSVMVLVV